MNLYIKLFYPLSVIKMPYRGYSLEEFDNELTQNKNPYGKTRKVPKSTLFRYKKQGIKHMKALGRKKLLTDSEQEQLAEYLRCEDNKFN